MKKILRGSLLAILVLVLEVSCISNERVDENAKRTVLVYMAGELMKENVANINISWMQQSLGNGMENAVLLAFVDKPGKKPCLIRIRKVSRDGDTGLDTLKIYNELNSADPTVLRQIIDEVKHDWPCESYGLVLWSHGTGWVPSSQLKNTELGWSAPRRYEGNGEPQGVEFDFSGNTKAFGVDKVDGKNVWIDIDDLVEALDDDGFDFILFDACYMGNVEVLYALRNKASYIISSSIEIWEDGFPYFNITRDLLNSHLVKVCESFFEYYSKDYSVPMAGISLVKTSELDSLARCFRKIIAHNDTIPQTDISGIQSMDWFNNHLFFDMEDFVDKLNSEYFNEFRLQLNACVMYKNSTPFIFPNDPVKKRKMDKYCGMSIYIPLVKYDSWGLNDEYRKTEWSIDTGY